MITEHAVGASRVDELKNFFGRKVAVDASMWIYQFIIAMREYEGGYSMELENANGEVTSHLNGMFMRTLKLIDAGIKPIFVFDGAPPDMKKETLAKRKEKAAEATAAMEVAKEAGDDEEMAKQAKRNVRVSKEQIEDVKKMLMLMGLPVVQAPCEAEAQCVELVKGGKAFCVATEDMDALTFGAPVLVRNLHSSDPIKRPVTEFRISNVIERMPANTDGTPFTMAQFIDLCILLGCDYTGTIRGIGPVKALEGMRQYKTIEDFLASLNQEKYPVNPEEFLFTEARELFYNPPVTRASEVTLSWSNPDEEGLKKFMCGEKIFSADRIDKGIEKLKAALGKKTQTRLDSFFGAKISQKLTQTVVTKNTGNALKGRPTNAEAGKKVKAVGHKKVVNK